MSELAPRPQESVRAPEYPQVGEYVGLQLRLALGGDALNPDTSSLPAITEGRIQQNPDVQSEQFKYDLMNKAALTSAEKIHQNDTRNNQDQWSSWKNEWVTYIGKAKDFYTQDQNGKEQAAILQKAGLDLAQFDMAQMDAIVREYFVENTSTGKTERDTKKFIDNILDNITDNAELDKVLPAVKLFAGMFGSGADNIDEIIVQDIKRGMKARNDQDRAALAADQAKATNLSEEEKKMLKTLWDARSQVSQTRPEPTRTPRADHGQAEDTLMSPVRAERQPLPEGDYRLQDIFKQIKGEVPLNNEYFITQPPPLDNPLYIPPDQLRALGTDKKFFVEYQNGWAPDQSLIPWKKFMEDTPIQRYIDAEAATNNDSGTLALAAISAADEKGQAAVYKTIAANIIQYHSQNPNALATWWAAQDKPIGPRNARTSQYVFKYNDQVHTRGLLGTRTSSKPENQRLLPWEGSDINSDNMHGYWEERIEDIYEALHNNKLTPDHLRWIEFLSHSVNISDMFKTVKRLSNTVSATPSLASQPETQPQPTPTPGSPDRREQPEPDLLQGTEQEESTDVPMGISPTARTASGFPRQVSVHPQDYSNQDEVGADAIGDPGSESPPPKSDPNLSQ